VYQECSKVLGIGKLLLLIYSGLCIHSQTIAQHGQKELEVGLDRKAGKSV